MIDNAKLLDIVERIENCNASIAEYTEDKRELLLEAKSAGLDPKAINHIVKLRKMDKEKREELAEIFTLYEHAMGL